MARSQEKQQNDDHELHLLFLSSREKKEMSEYEREEKHWGRVCIFNPSIVKGLSGMARCKQCSVCEECAPELLRETICNACRRHEPKIGAQHTESTLK